MNECTRKWTSEHGNETATDFSKGAPVRSIIKSYEIRSLSVRALNSVYYIYIDMNNQYGWIAFITGFTHTKFCITWSKQVGCTKATFCYGFFFVGDYHLCSSARKQQVDGGRIAGSTAGSTADMSNRHRCGRLLGWMWQTVKMFSWGKAWYSSSCYFFCSSRGGCGSW